MRYYVDTCIWLNLFQRERGPERDRPHWQLASEFIKRITQSGDNTILYSGVVLREFETTLDEAAAREGKAFLEGAPEFVQVEVTSADRAEARKVESKYGFTISFADCTHLVLARKMNATLITRDRALLEIAAEERVRACRPEEITGG
jgi:predicted nucleic acid-binding protein